MYDDAAWESGNLEAAEYRFSFKKKNYVLAEMEETLWDNYRRVVNEHVKHDEKGEVAEFDQTGLNSVHLQGSLYEIDDKGAWRALTLEEIGRWPARIIEGLKVRLRKMSGLATVDKGEAAKNESSETTTSAPGSVSQTTTESAPGSSND